MTKDDAKSRVKNVELEGEKYLLNNWINYVSPPPYLKTICDEILLKRFVFICID